MNKIILLFFMLHFNISNSESMYYKFNSFSENEWKHLQRWECPKWNKEENYCELPCIVLKTKKTMEYNCFGITVKSNFQFFSGIMEMLTKKNEVRTGLVCTNPLDDYVKSYYFNNYFMPFKEAPKCLRLLLFDISVLSGRKMAVKLYSKASATKKKPINQLMEIKKLYLSYLSKLHNWTKYKNGWTNRVNDVINKSKKNCY